MNITLIDLTLNTTVNVIIDDTQFFLTNEHNSWYDNKHYNNIG